MLKSIHKLRVIRQGLASGSQGNHKVTTQLSFTLQKRVKVVFEYTFMNIYTDLRLM